MDFELNSDQLAYVSMAKNFAEKELAPNASKWDQDDPTRQTCIDDQVYSAARAAFGRLIGGGVFNVDAQTVVSGDGGQ